MANESTVNNEVVDNVNVEPQTDGVSSDNKIWDEKYPKWQKMLPKDYWGSEKLSKYDSLTAVIEDAINPKVKAPEKYDLKVSNSEFATKLGESFKKADVGTAEAEEIVNLFNAQMPKVFTEEDEKETFGLGDYEVVKAYKENAINRICAENTQLKEAIVNSKFYHDPTFVNFAKIVGKNLGNGTIEDFKPEATKDNDDIWAKWTAQRY